MSLQSAGSTHSPGGSVRERFWQRFFPRLQPGARAWELALGSWHGRRDGRQGRPALCSSCRLLPRSAGPSLADAPPWARPCCRLRLLPLPEACSVRRASPLPRIPRGVGREGTFRGWGAVQRLVRQRLQREVCWGINNGFCNGEKEFLNMEKKLLI